MWEARKPIYCPVCQQEMGYWSKKFKQTFICSECKWLYEAEPSTGKIKALHKVDEKHTPQKCGCRICGR